MLERKRRFWIGLLAIATLAVPAAGLALDQVRAGIVYQTGARDPGWDLHIDELHCTFH